MLEFEKLVSKYNPMLHMFVNRTFVSGYEKEDLLQEALMVLHQASVDFDKSRGAKFSTYLYVRLRNHMANLIKTSKDLFLVDNTDTIIESIESPYDNEIMEDVEFIRKSEMLIIEKLHEIPRGYITLWLTYEGLTQEEVALKEGISQQRVAYLHKRNLSRLKDIFIDKFTQNLD